MIGLAKVAKEMDEDTANHLQNIAQHIKSLKAQSEEQKAELERWEKKQATEPKIANILKNSKKSIKELPPQQQIQLIKQLLIGIALTQNTIKLDPRLGKPITGNIRKNPQWSSHPYSYLDLDWE